MKIIYMGTPDFAVAPLKMLIDSDYEVSCVVSQPDANRDRGKKIKPTPVKQLAVKYNIDVLQPKKIRDNEEFFNELRSYEPDLIVVAAYGKILPKEILNMARFGCINIHGSLLPRWRGAAPVQRAIVAGDKISGATLMYMNEGLDTGDIIDKVEIDIYHTRKNSDELFEAVSVEGGKLLIRNLPKIFSEGVKRIVQDNEKATYAPLISKEEGLLDFNKNARELDCQIRGFFTWPGCYTYLRGEVFKIWEAEPCEENFNVENGKIIRIDKNGILVSCEYESLLLKVVQVPNKRRMKVEDFIKGNNIENGSILGIK